MKLFHNGEEAPYAVGCAVSVVVFLKFGNPEFQKGVLWFLMSTLFLWVVGCAVWDVFGYDVREAWRKGRRRWHKWRSPP